MLSSISIVAIYCWVVFHCVDIPQFIHTFACCQTLGLLLLRSYYKQVSYNHLCTSLCVIYACIPLGLISKNEMARLYGRCIFKKLLSYFPERVYIVPSHWQLVRVPVAPPGIWFVGQERWRRLGAWASLSFPSNHYDELISFKFRAPRGRAWV